jgi:hypothetical protein
MAPHVVGRIDTSRRGRGNREELGRQVDGMQP